MYNFISADYSDGIRLSDGSVARTLEAQVLKNKQDIAAHYNIDRVLADFGIKVLGQVATVDILQDLPKDDLQYGDAYAVGIEPPYDFYIWTRANMDLGEDIDYWFSIGKLAIAGPEGLTGPAPVLAIADGYITSTDPLTQETVNVIGINDIRANYIFTFPGAPTLGSTRSVRREWGVLSNRTGDFWLDTNTGDLYRQTGVTSGQARWSRDMNIKGPQGEQGIQGPRGETGPQGIQGVPGPRGLPSFLYTVAGTVGGVGQLPAVESVGANDAYLVGTTGAYHLYIVVDGIWTDLGPTNQMANATPNTFITIDGNGASVNTTLYEVSITLTDFNNYQGVKNGEISFQVISTDYPTVNTVDAIWDWMVRKGYTSISSQYIACNGSGTSGPNDGSYCVVNRITRIAADPATQKKFRAHYEAIKTYIDGTPAEAIRGTLNITTATISSSALPYKKPIL